MEKNESLVSKDFLPDGIKMDESRIFPMAVIATMSSGKSTLINALLGKDILPTSNAACTSLSYFILDDDQNAKEIICATDLSGKTTVIEENLVEELVKLNQDVNVSSVFIRSDVKGVLNTDKALLMIDTPGPNNARNLSHEEMLYRTISKIKGGLFLYVMNATQLAIVDDKNLLYSLKNVIRKNPGISILFVVNKVDTLDEERGESIEECIFIARKYLENLGFKEASIVPVSALAALLFKKVLNGERLTRIEYREFLGLYDLYEPKDYNMKKYAITEDLAGQFDVVKVTDGKHWDEFKVGDLNQAIENTGIKVLEECIQKAQILSSEKIKNIVKVKIR